MHSAEFQPLAGMDRQQPHRIDPIGGRWHLAQLFFVAECLETPDPPQQLLPGIAVAGRLVFGRELQELIDRHALACAGDRVIAKHRVQVSASREEILGTAGPLPGFPVGQSPDEISAMPTPACRRP